LNDKGLLVSLYFYMLRIRRVEEKGFRYLKVPVRRIGLLDISTPAGFTLEQYFYPDKKKITEIIKDMVKI